MIKIVIDDDEEAVLPLEAEVALRRRAAEVGFSTLDWIGLRRGRMGRLRFAFQWLRARLVRPAF